MAYDHREIEKKAQEKWAALDLYTADLSDDAKEPYYLLVEFPYPSGDLHIGHWYAFAVTDIYARLLRLRGKNVLFPIGFDAFGLPAENAAIKNGVDPKEWTYKNIERMRDQLKSMGPSFDWSKEVLTCDPSYYQWTQWLFSKLFEHNLAEHREAAVKWCPKDQTVLANEQVQDGCCERCGTPVEEKRLTQWFLKITDYAERLLSGLDPLPWREEIKEAQRAWIGKSEGAYLDFALVGREEKIKVFTTRPDTIFGVTYVVLAPEHPLVAMLLDSVSNKKAVQKYITATASKTERERSENKEKTGVKLEGIFAINSATKEEVPVYIADYALASYGTGAVMAVPAHDERDGAFAKNFNLPVRDVIMPSVVDTVNVPRAEKPTTARRNVHAIVYDPKKDAYLALRSVKHDWDTVIIGGVEEGESLEDAARREVVEETGYTDLVYKRTLGAPVQAAYFAKHKDENRIAISSALYFELASDAQQAIADGEDEENEIIWVPSKDFVPGKMINSELPYWLERLAHEDITYTGPGVLTNSGDFNGKNSEEMKWDIVASVSGEKATNYRLRDWLVSRQRYWGCPIPIVYDPEGKPHVVPAEHLPWLLPTDVDFRPTGEAPLASSAELKERVTRIFGEGWIPEFDTFDTFMDSSWYFLRYLDSQNVHDFSSSALMKKWMPINRYSGGSEHTTMHLLYARFFMKALYDLALVPVDEPFNERLNRGLIMGPDGQKMSKSKGNVVNPDEFVQKYGADAVRIYLAFIGPYNEPGNYPWNLDGVASMRKFLERVTRLPERVSKETEVTSVIQQALARASIKVAEDGDRFKFNTSISALMVLVNAFESQPTISINAFSSFVVMFAPFAPHLAEHLWEQISGEGSVHQQSWPIATLSVVTEQEIVVQVNGKRRGSIVLPIDAIEDTAVIEARKLSSVVTALDGSEPKRIVYVPGRILNLVV